jgi:hypothetical protein
MSDAMATLRKAGITLEVDGGNLVARPRSAITDELRGLIRANKGGLMAELRPDDGIEVIRQAFGIEKAKVLVHGATVRPGEAGADGGRDGEELALAPVNRWAEDFARKAAREPGYSAGATPHYCCTCRNRAEDKRCLAWAQLGARAGWKPKDLAPRKCRGFVRKAP